ncbi:lytic polysaccharide monooxygenase auxiliary activity family 9 protein [Pilimelia anulata]|nr:lytic polysaccharide monooxygenase [Pilimelia anulata]
MRPWRTAAAIAVAGLVAVLVPAAAGAHGSVQRPASRGYACGPEGAARSTDACVAARAEGDVTDWDNLRVPNVAGRDAEVIPDGQLCSAGIRRYAGLDLVRDDWPATTLRSGAELTFRYRTTIPHRGTFRFYVTNRAYTPDRPLRWADLEREPFLSVTDPEVVDGVYEISGRLPADRSGRQLIYTIWQNSDTPDTYYSCSDVLFSATGADGTDTGAADDPAASGAPDGAAATAPANRVPLPAGGLGRAVRTGSVDLVTYRLLIISVTLLGVAAIAGFTLVRLRRRRSG